MRACFTKKALLICTLLLFLINGLVGKEIPQRYDWLNLKPTALKEWKIVENLQDNQQISLKSEYTVQTDESISEKKIMVLFPKKSSAYDTALSKILDIFLEKQIPALFTVINFRNIPEEGKKAIAYAEKNSFDLIFSMGSASTVFVHQYYSKGEIQVVTVCSKDPVARKQMSGYEEGSQTNIAYTSLDIPAELQLRYLLEMNKNLKNIIIMYARSNSSAIEAQVTPLKELSSLRQINCIDLIVEDQSMAKIELEQKIPIAVKKIKIKDPDLSKTIFWITGSTSVFREIETINKYSDNIPVLSIPTDVVKEGDNSAVLSIGVSFESNAHLAALYGTGILMGEYEAGKLKVGVVSNPDIAINFKKAKQIGLKLPFLFFESATIIYDYNGKLVRKAGQEDEPK